jgi:ABC-type transport system substrate-binding protein
MISALSCSRRQRGSGACRSRYCRPCRAMGPGFKVTVSTRNIAWYRDPAAILIDQLKEIWIDGELETVETANWAQKLMCKDFTVALSLSGSAVDDPDLTRSFTRTTPAARRATTPATATAKWKR